MYPLGSGFLSTQWAAVTTQPGLIRDPPQMCRPFTLREICQGHECGAASSPLTTRAPGGREPHPEIHQYMRDYGVNRQMKTQKPRLPYMIVTFLWNQIKVIPKIKKAPVTDHEEICGLGSFTRIERKMNCIVLFFSFMRKSGKLPVILKQRYWYGYILVHALVLKNGQKKHSQFFHAIRKLILRHTLL